MTTGDLRTNHRSRELRGSATCPHCGGPAKIRSNRRITSTFRQLTIACLDEECGATFRGDLTITHEISAGASPNPLVVLAKSAPRRRGAANDDVPARDRGPEVPPPPANDQAEIAATG